MAARRKLGADFQASLAAKFDAIVFDKDGTLLDFAATWYPAIYAAIRAAAPTEEAAGKIASALGFDMESRTCAPDSPVIKSSMAELEALLSPHTDGRALLDACGDLVLQHVTPMPASLCRRRASARAEVPGLMRRLFEKSMAEAGPKAQKNAKSVIPMHECRLMKWSDQSQSPPRE